VHTLSSFIRRERDAIVREWSLRAEKLPSAQRLTRGHLHDHVPTILDRISDAIDRHDDGPRPLADLPEQHGLLRFHDGYDLRQVVAEYRMLRHVIVDLYTEQDGLSADARAEMKPLLVMHETVDRAISESVDQFAVERDRVRDRFIAILGHDLREPLHTILFSLFSHHAQLLRADELDTATIQVTARIVNAAKRMNRMIADLLDFARGRLGGGISIVPVRFDARTLITETVREIADTHPERDVQCGSEYVTGDFGVEWDSDRIAQVIANLVGNALVHGRDPVIVTMADEGDSVSIAVSNRGSIPTDVLPHVFDPFVPGTVDARRDGLGLGLYIVQQIAHGHGGTVAAESTQDDTTLVVRLPRRARDTTARS
jgi:signal transduction histidine kinase